VAVLTASHAVERLVEAPRCKPAGHGFDSRWCHLYNPSGRTTVLGSTQSLTEMSTRNVFWRQMRPVRGADFVPPSCADCLEIWKPQTPGTLTACPVLHRDCFSDSLYLIISNRTGPLLRLEMR